MHTLIQSNSPVLQAGKFRHRVTILQPTNAQDTAGGTSGANTTELMTVWGTVEALTAEEKFAAHEFVSQVTHRVIIRYERSIPITSAMLVCVDGRRFQIEGVLNPDQRNKLLALMCIEINDSTNQ